MRRFLSLLTVWLAGLTACSSNMNPASLPQSGDLLEKPQMVRSSVGLCYWQEISLIGYRVYPSQFDVITSTGAAVSIKFSHLADANRIRSKPHFHVDVWSDEKSFEGGAIRRFRPRKNTGSHVQYFVTKQFPEGTAVMRFQSPLPEQINPKEQESLDYARRWLQTVRLCGPEKREPLLTETETEQLDRIHQTPLPKTLVELSNFCPAEDVRHLRLQEQHLGNRGAVRCLYEDGYDRAAIYLTRPMFPSKKSFDQTVDELIASDEFITTNLTAGRPYADTSKVCRTQRSTGWVYAECDIDDAVRHVWFVKRADRIQISARITSGQLLSHGYHQSEPTGEELKPASNKNQTTIGPCPINKTNWC
jgi:hypothetical protein